MFGMEGVRDRIPALSGSGAPPDASGPGKCGGLTPPGKMGGTTYVPGPGEPCGYGDDSPVPCSAAETDGHTMRMDCQCC